MFKVCDGVFDEKSGIYHPNTLTEKYKCCLDLCLPSHQYCVEQCKDKVKTLYSKELNEGKMTISEALTRCEKLCSDTHSICTHTCNLLSPKFQYGNNYHECAVNSNCNIGQNLHPSSKCVSDNKDKIMDCCLKSGATKEYCNFQENRSLLRNIVIENTKRDIELSNNDYNPNTTLILVIISVILGIIIPILFINNRIIGYISFIVSIITLIVVYYIIK